jgi:hypothetical protein
MLKFVKIILAFLVLKSCTAADKVTGERVLIEPDAKKRAQIEAEKSGGIFGNLGKNNKNAEIEFKNSNVLWRATLKSLDFLPLINADYSGGVIIYDWYSNDINSKEQIKITVRFLNNDLRSDSLEIISHKKICDESNKCLVSVLKNGLSNEIKDKILSSARSIKIEEKKKDNQ